MKSLRWVKWLAEVAGLNAERADFVPLGTKDEKVTAAAFVSSENGVRRALVLVMGSNRLPGERGRDLLADALRQ